VSEILTKRNQNPQNCVHFTTFLGYILHTYDKNAWQSYLLTEEVAWLWNKEKSKSITMVQGTLDLQLTVW